MNREYARLKFKAIYEYHEHPDGSVYGIPKGYKIEGLNGLSFDNKYELFKYMKQFKDVSVPLSDVKEMQRILFGNTEAYHKYMIETTGKTAKEYSDSVREFMLKHSEELLEKAKKKN